MFGIPPKRDIEIDRLKNQILDLERALDGKDAHIASLEEINKALRSDIDRLRREPAPE